MLPIIHLARTSEKRGPIILRFDQCNMKFTVFVLFVEAFSDQYC